MRYRTEIAQRALKALKDIPSADRERIRLAIRALGDDPRPRGCLKLQQSPDWRIRVGVYRVIYQIEEGRLLVLVVKIGHRKDVYREG
jgi:mRNA interferase RelE/StbE